MRRRGKKTKKEKTSNKIEDYPSCIFKFNSISKDFNSNKRGLGSFCLNDKEGY